MKFVMIEAGWSLTLSLCVLMSLMWQGSSLSPMAAALAPSTSNNKENESPTSSSGEGNDIYTYFNPELYDDTDFNLDGRFDEYALPDNQLGDEFEVAKRGQRNFLRFGRRPQSFDGIPIAIDLIDPSTVDVKRGKNFLRFGRNGRNFLRFGRAKHRNYIRFGRSTDRQTEDHQPNIQSEVASIRLSEKLPTDKGHKVKRSVGIYDDLWVTPPTPFNFDSNLNNWIKAQRDTDKDTQKRGQGRNFLRFGRDPSDLHFLRFGKGGHSDASSFKGGAKEDSELARYIRGGLNKNFLRFG